MQPTKISSGDFDRYAWLGEGDLEVTSRSAGRSRGRSARVTALRAAGEASIMDAGERETATGS